MGERAADIRYGNHEGEKKHRCFPAVHAPLILLSLVLLMLGSACAEGGIDYSDPYNWAYYGIGEGKDADLFLICPTVDRKDEYLMSITDEENRASFLGALNMQRGIYEDSARLFAPYYRQATMKASSLPAEEWDHWTEEAFRDVSDAFAYYLENENQGRPIILAGFSQGADMCYRLMDKYFGDEELFSRLVAVYALGWPCPRETAERCPQIVPASGPDDIGVVISFECEAEDVTDTFVYPAGRRAFSINPLNWKTDSTPADKAENPGACFTDYSGNIRREVPQLCGCYLDMPRGTLKVTDVDKADYPPVVPGLPEGAYHVYDYQFFFRDLQENVMLRLQTYLSKQSEADAA